MDFKTMEITRKMLIEKIPNRLRLIVCLLFGHDWYEYGSETSASGRILEEHVKCDMCKLEYRDNSGRIKEYEESMLLANAGG